MSLIFCLTLGYLIGGIPTGIIVGKFVKGIDPRSSGSGSSGATNVSRVLGKKWAAIVLIADVLKGLLPTLFLAPFMAPAERLAVGKVLMASGAVLGHVWTPYAGFKGGKGVATAAGAIFGIDPLSATVALGVWITVFVFLKTVSIASIAAAGSLPVAMIVLGDRPNAYILCGIFLACFLVYTHRENIERLLNKTEKPIL